MNELTIAVVFIPLGFIGAYAHYFKKFYIDKTTNCTLLQYLRGNLPSTLYAIGTIIFSEISLASITSSISLGAIVGALTAGYTADSVIDRAPYSVQVGLNKAIDSINDEKLNNV
jgi:hypothetical protein